jgi:hypothetical protein
MSNGSESVVRDYAGYARKGPFLGAPMTALCRRAWSCSSNYSVQGGFGGWLVGDGGLSVAFFPFLSFLTTPQSCCCCRVLLCEALVV